MFKNQTLKFFVVDHRHDYLLYHDHDDHGWSENEPIQLEWNMIIVMDALGRGTHPLEVDGDDDQSVTGHNFFSDTGTGHIVPEQYSIQKEYPKHSVSRKEVLIGHWTLEDFEKIAFFQFSTFFHKKNAETVGQNQLF